MRSTKCHTLIPDFLFLLSFLFFFFFGSFFFFDKDSYQISYSPIMDKISIKLGFGMTTGRVRGGFLYNQTCLVGLPLLPEPAPFNKRVFFKTPKSAPSGPCRPCPVMPNPKSQTQTPIRPILTQMQNFQI